MAAVGAVSPQRAPWPLAPSPWHVAMATRAEPGAGLQGHKELP